MCTHQIRVSKAYNLFTRPCKSLQADTHSGSSLPYKNRIGHTQIYRLRQKLHTKPKKHGRSHAILSLLFRFPVAYYCQLRKTRLKFLSASAYANAYHIIQIVYYFAFSLERQTISFEIANTHYALHMRRSTSISREETEESLL